MKNSVMMTVYKMVDKIRTAYDRYEYQGTFPLSLEAEKNKYYFGFSEDELVDAYRWILAGEC